MEVREKYVARLMNDPATHGFSEIKFVHTPQIVTGKWVRLRCQYVCQAARQSELVPPFSPTVADTVGMLDEYKFGILVRREIPMPPPVPRDDMWHEFQESLLRAEKECFLRGYGKAFALGVGNCLFCHTDDSLKPCEFPWKSRPTLESIGVNLYDTLDMIGWDMYIVREPSEPFQMFGLLLLE